MLALISYEPLLRVGIGPLEISPHGIFAALGLWIGVRILQPRARAAGVDDEDLFALLVPSVVVALVGARTAYVLNHIDDYDTLYEVFAVWEGGASLLGGLVPAVAVGAWLARRRGLSGLALLDAAAPAAAIGIAVGRIGDLIIADHLGKPTSFFLAYECPASRTGSPCVAEIGQGVHQTALYDLIGASIIAVALLALRRRHPRNGGVAAAFAVSYGLLRFAEGFARLDETHGTGLSGSQWTAAGVVALVLASATIDHRRRAHGRVDRRRS